MNDTLNQVLDLRTLGVGYGEETGKEVSLEVPPENDFEYARQNIKDTIETSISAINSLAKISDQSQHPRAYEVLANLAKTIVDANKELLQIHKHNPGGVQQQKPSEVTNNLFVGSTAQLQDLLKTLKQEKRQAITLEK